MLLISLLATFALVAALPIVLRPNARAHAAELEVAAADYWVVARRTASLEFDARARPDYARSFAEQRELWKHVHLLGGHIDEGHDPCEWSGYLGAWRLLLARLGL